MKTKTHSIQHLHAIDAFGILKVSMSGIRIERLEVRIKPGVPFPHRHDFFQVLVVTAGTGWHQIDFKKHDVKAGDIFLMKPGQMHSWGLKKGIKGFIIEFNHQSLNDRTLLEQFSYCQDVHTFKHKKKFQQFCNLIEVMRDEFQDQNENFDLCLRHYLMNFLIFLTREHGLIPEEKKTLSVIEKFKSLIEKHFKTSHNVEFYAKQLGISPKTLTMQLSRSIGKPPRFLIQERILLEAKRFLAFTPMSVADVGFELGFEDANYFTRFFRLHEKYTPAQFRKSKSLS